MKFIRMSVICFLSILIACQKETAHLSPCTVAGSITQKTTRLEDEQLLLNLLNDLALSAQNTQCTGTEQWGITPLGAKPCGGPASYLVYNKAIDTTCFMQKVKQYTLLAEQFNTKYQLISDCSLMAMPIKVTCVNGKPIMGY